MKNHDIHENKNVCPEFNGEKMHDYPLNKKTTASEKFAVVFSRNAALFFQTLLKNLLFYDKI